MGVGWTTTLRRDDKEKVIVELVDNRFTVITNYDVIGGNFETKSTLACTELAQIHGFCHSGSHFLMKI